MGIVKLDLIKKHKMAAKIQRTFRNFLRIKYESMKNINKYYA